MFQIQLLLVGILIHHFQIFYLRTECNEHIANEARDDSSTQSTSRISSKNTLKVLHLFRQNSHLH
jgi:hypothetical protein